MDGFVQWMHEDQNYALAATSNYLNAVPKVVRWLRSRQIHLLTQVTLQHLKVAPRYFRSRQALASSAVRGLERFLRAQGTLPEGETPAPSPVEAEIARFATYLGETRGLAQKTIRGHSQRLRCFLRFLHFDRSRSPLRQLQPRPIEAFLRQSARTHNRHSLQPVGATVRAFLKQRHAQGLLSRPLHLQIDAPRVYRGERLPRALPWVQVQGRLQSIDRSEPFGRRDFTLLYRQLFLSTKAPRGPLQPTAVRQVMAHRLQRSRLNPPPCGTNVLRHSFAMRRLLQGVTLKAIGDAMGHRNIESTFVYIRLDGDALREVALPVPATVAGDPVSLVPPSRLPRLRPTRPARQLPKHFHSRLAASLQR